MSIEIVQGTNQKPASSGQLVKLLSGDTGLSGQLFVGYPIIGTTEGPYIIDALLVSLQSGVTIINLVEGRDVDEHESLQDDSVNKLESKLKLHRNLLQRRDLLIPIHVISFIPALNNPADYDTEDYPVANSETLLRKLNALHWAGSTTKLYSATLSVIENISTIRHGRVRRTVKREDSRGAKLKALEDSIATLDNMQSKAVIETVDGVQRIRGLAGSGKTIVLALKAAYLHSQHPNWRIAVTFNTRSLKGQFRRLIHNFSLEQTNQEPDWELLRVVTAWGAPGGSERDGIYYEFCRLHDAEYLDFQSSRTLRGRGDPFSKVCALALKQLQDTEPVYDAILVDEAQDFSPAFLQLCYALLKPPKRLVYAYDELQSLTDESLPSPEDIFQARDIRGITDPGDEGPRNDIILEKCYRNSRPVLVTAHALGFGIYRRPPAEGKPGLIQMFDNSQLWTEVGYRVTDGGLGDGQQVALQRTPDTSPRFLEDHSLLEDLVQFVLFESTDEQDEWLTQAIKHNLLEDELRHDDIVVINPDPLTTRGNVASARRLLWDMGINSHIAGVDTDPDVFFQTEEESVTFTGVFRAKGNEAGMVYVINAQDCHSSALNLARIRNQLFTAITRSKAWVRVLGVGRGMKELMKEYQELKDREFELRFTYPDAEQRKQLRLLHRDMTTKERKRLQGRQRNLSELVRDLESGQMLAEDLDEAIVAKLKHLLG